MNIYLIETLSNLPVISTGLNETDAINKAGYDAEYPLIFCTQIVEEDKTDKTMTETFIENIGLSLNINLIKE